MASPPNPARADLSRPAPFATKYPRLAALSSLSQALPHSCFSAGRRETPNTRPGLGKSPSRCAATRPGSPRSASWWTHGCLGAGSPWGAPRQPVSRHARSPLSGRPPLPVRSDSVVPGMPGGGRLQRAAPDPPGRCSRGLPQSSVFSDGLRPDRRLRRTYHNHPTLSSALVNQIGYYEPSLGRGSVHPRIHDSGRHPWTAAWMAPDGGPGSESQQGVEAPGSGWTWPRRCSGIR